MQIYINLSFFCKKKKHQNGTSFFSYMNKTAETTLWKSFDEYKYKKTRQFSEEGIHMVCLYVLY